MNIAIERQAATTAFIALHEPFENGRPQITAFERLDQTASAVAVKILGSTQESGERYQDIILTRFDRHTADSTTLTVDGHDISFNGYAWLRRQGQQLTIVGQLVEAQILAPGVTQVKLNGIDISHYLSAGVLAIAP